MKPFYYLAFFGEPIINAIDEESERLELATGVTAVWIGMIFGLVAGIFSGHGQLSALAFWLGLVGASVLLVLMLLVLGMMTIHQIFDRRLRSLMTTRKE